MQSVLEAHLISNYWQQISVHLANNLYTENNCYIAQMSSPDTPQQIKYDMQFITEMQQSSFYQYPISKKMQISKD